jgi:hypothetical protein
MDILVAGEQKQNKKEMEQRYKHKEKQNRRCHKTLLFLFSLTVYGGNLTCSIFCLNWSQGSWVPFSILRPCNQGSKHFTGCYHPSRPQSYTLRCQLQIELIRVSKSQSFNSYILNFDMRSSSGSKHKIRSDRCGPAQGPHGRGHPW